MCRPQFLFTFIAWNLLWIVIPAVLLFFLVKTIIVSGNLELAQGDSGRPEPRPVSVPSRRSLKRLERRLLQHDQALHALRLHQTVGNA